MADTGLTGATTEVEVDNTAANDSKKKIIKYVVIALIVIGAWFVVKKYILK